jgi:hypothetical protein
MIAQSRQRRPKKPIDTIRDKYENITKPSQSEFPTPVLMHSEIPTEPTKITMPEPAPEVKSKKSNAWISHVKSIAGSKGIKFRDALRDPETKATYKK